MSDMPASTDRRRSVTAYLVTVVVLLVVLVPLVVLDWDIPFVGAVAMILAGATVVYSVERWEDPGRASERWLGLLPMGAALLVTLGAVIGLYVILLG